MSCGNCGNSMKLCPFSFGLAMGLTAALASLVWMCWVMYAGQTPMMVQFNIPVPTLHEGAIKAFYMLLKGFAAGVVFALIYDMIACCCRSMCCKKSGEQCDSGECCDDKPKKRRKK